MPAVREPAATRLAAIQTRTGMNREYAKALEEYGGEPGPDRELRAVPALPRWSQERFVKACRLRYAASFSLVLISTMAMQR